MKYYYLSWFNNLKKLQLNQLIRIVQIVFIFFFCTTLHLFADNSPSLNTEVNSQQQQTITISGTVTDVNNEPIIGANVSVKGTTTGVITDADGKFTITVPSKESVITVDFVGYVSMEILVGNKQTINIVMKEDVKIIDEVVVVGYGVQRRSDITGAISQVKSSDLLDRSTSDAAAALQGKVSGVQILNTSGQAGEGSVIRIRGYSSNNGGSTSPLLVVDGLIVDNIQYLDPNMIESIEVLKDAASAAIYGAQAGNGVVLVTTKRAKIGEGKIFYEYKLIQNSLGKYPETLNSKQFIEYKTLEGVPNLVDTGYDTNWFKETYEPSTSQSHTVGFQGANERSNVFMSLNYTDNEGIVKGPYDFYKRLTGQINAEYKIKSYLTVGTNQSIEKWERVSVSDRSDWQTLGLAVLRSSPLIPAYYDNYDALPADLKTQVDNGKNVLIDPDNGKYYGVNPNLNIGSPLIARERGKNNNTQGFNIRGTLYLNFTPIKEITYTSRLGYRISQGFNKNYTVPFYANGTQSDVNYNLSESSSNGWYYQWDNFVNLNKKFGKHNLGAMLGMSYVQNESRGTSGSLTGPDILTGYAPNFIYLGYASGSATKGNGETNSTGVNMAYFGRLTWSYDNRYNLQANFRADAFDSSRLPVDKRWGYFPSFSAGWTISNEAFMRDIAHNIKMDMFRIRAAYGQNGNINVLSNYAYNATITADGANFYQFGADSNASTQGRKPSGMVNKDLKWETLIQTDLGFDARFFKNRMNFGFDYFKKETKDILVGVNVFPESGITGTTTVNSGSILNSGLEFELGWSDKIGDFKYSVSANFSKLKNEVTSIDPSLSYIAGRGTMNGKAGTRFQKGYPVWYIAGYEFDKIATADGNYIDKDGNAGTPYKAGNALMKDLNGDGKIGDEDLTMIGSGIPKATYGITVSLAYKNFDLNIFGTGVMGNKILIYYYDALANANQNMLSYYYDNYWSPQNTTGTKPYPVNMNKQEYFSSDANVFKGDFFRIKQIQLGYSLPGSILKKVFVSNLRFFVSLDDFITFTKYPGFDPEASSVDTNQGLGIDFGNVPISKKVMFGLNLSF